MHENSIYSDIPSIIYLIGGIQKGSRKGSRKGGSMENKNKNKNDFEKDYEPLALEYLENCRKYDLKVDASVLISLKTGWNIFQPTKLFSEGAMLPLLGILEKSDFISKLNLSNITMHDTR